MGFHTAGKESHPSANSSLSSVQSSPTENKRGGYMKAEPNLDSAELPKPETDSESGTRDGDCLTSSDGSGFICYKCGETFTVNSHLLAHLCGIHGGICAGEKPSTCSERGKGFTEKSNLHIHLRNHTGEKPFTCTECGKCFTEKHNLNLHEKIHTGEKQFTCTEKGGGKIDKKHTLPIVQRLLSEFLAYVNEFSWLLRPTHCPTAIY
eukprot:XP_017945479.1 PREDICTED: zinc finger protein 350-like [Xenopus tropicalis]